MSPQQDHSLPPQEKEQFDNNGFLGPFTLLEPEEMKETWERIKRELQVLDRAAYPNSKFHFDRHLDVAILQELVSSPRIVAKMQSILGPEVLCWRSQWFPKKPGDEGTDWHQTQSFTEFEGDPKLAPTKQHTGPYELTAWLSIFEATEENGCLQVIPGTHREKLNYDEIKNITFNPTQMHQKYVNGVKRGSYGYSYDQLKLDPNWSPDESRAVSLTLRPGQFVIFTSRLLHSSLPNVTQDDERLGYAIRYCAGDVQVYPNRDSFSLLGETHSLERYRPLVVAG